MIRVRIKKSRSLTDILGIMLSMVCAIQCAIAPILLSIAPIIPKWAHFGHGWGWISIILLVAALSLGRGYLKHKNKKVMYLAVFGIMFLLLGLVVEEKLSVLIESAIFVSGGVLLSCAHWKNYKLAGLC
ncbi:MAG: MerC domain-containing protein [Proteobacteria bacterium]|nr:MerC domain-containing protein [Pseudomonadota bacterium]